MKQCFNCNRAFRAASFRFCPLCGYPLLQIAKQTKPPPKQIKLLADGSPKWAYDQRTKSYRNPAEYARIICEEVAERESAMNFQRDELLSEVVDISDIRVINYFF